MTDDRDAQGEYAHHMDCLRQQEIERAIRRCEAALRAFWLAHGGYAEWSQDLDNNRA